MIGAMRVPTQVVESARRSRSQTAVMSSRSPPRSVRPLTYSNTPVVGGRAGVARDEVDMKMGYVVAEHKAVDVLCTLALLE